MAIEDREANLTYPALIAADLLTAVVGAGGRGFLEIRLLPSGEQRFFSLAHPDAIYGAVEFGQSITEEDVYFGIAPRALETGTNEAVQEVCALFADCDNDPAVDALAAFTPEPSFLVQSGGLTEHGRPKLHAYWTLSEPVGPEIAREAKKSIARALGSDPAVHDPARIARLPGSRYHKDGSGRAVRVAGGAHKARYPLADVLAKLPPPTPPAPTTNGAAVGAIPEGARNASLASDAGVLRRLGWAADAMETALLARNESACDPPLDELEVRRIAKSIGRYPSDAQTLESGRHVVTVAASEIRAQQVQWAWRDRVPQAALTILAGQQGLGKSTLALTLCAQMTTGQLEGDLEGHAVPVLIVTLEDHLATVAKPRLLAAHANLQLAQFLTVQTGDGVEDLITLPDDIAAIERKAEAIGAKLLVIDPVVATLGVAIDGHKDQHVRRAFAPLAQLAERQNLAILGVMHLNKAQTGDLISRVSGSTAFTAAPRSVLAFARDPGDPDGEEGDRRVIVHAKSNWGPRTDTLACRIEQRSGIADGKTYRTSRLAFTGTSGVTAADIVGNGPDQGSIDDAAQFLRAELADGPKSVQALKSAAKTLSLAWRTVERAKTDLKIQSTKTGMAGGWEWSLPEGRQPLGGLGDQDAGGLRETPVTTGVSGESDPRRPPNSNVAVFGADGLESDTDTKAQIGSDPTNWAASIDISEFVRA